MTVPNPTTDPGTDTEGISAPYEIGSLNAPLTVTQRKIVTAYIEAYGYSSSQITRYITDTALNGGFANLGNLQKSKDVALIGAYNAVAAGGGFGVAPTNKNINWGLLFKILDPWKYSREGYLHGPQGGPNPISAIKNVTDFLKLLTEGQVWVRVGEFAAGAILITVGFSKAFPTATRYAAKAIK
jgi:hypothetical protein